MGGGSSQAKRQETDEELMDEGDITRTYSDQNENDQQGETSRLLPNMMINLGPFPSKRDTVMHDWFFPFGKPKLHCMKANLNTNGAWQSDGETRRVESRKSDFDNGGKITQDFLLAFLCDQDKAFSPSPPDVPGKQPGKENTSESGDNESDSSDDELYGQLGRRRFVEQGKETCSKSLVLVYGCWPAVNLEGKEEKTSPESLKYIDIIHHPPKLFWNVKLNATVKDFEVIEREIEFRRVIFGELPIGRGRRMAGESQTMMIDGSARGSLQVHFVVKDQNASPETWNCIRRDLAMLDNETLRKCSTFTLHELFHSDIKNGDAFYRHLIANPLQYYARAKYIERANLIGMTQGRNASPYKPISQEEYFRMRLAELNLPKYFWRREEQALLEHRLHKIVSSRGTTDEEAVFCIPMEICQEIAFTLYGAIDPRERRRQ